MNTDDESIDDLSSSNTFQDATETQTFKALWDNLNMKLQLQSKHLKQTQNFSSYSEKFKNKSLAPWRMNRYKQRNDKRNHERRLKKETRDKDADKQRD